MGEILDFGSNTRGTTRLQAAPRRLAAILAADVSGFSRLLRIDQRGTYEKVKRIKRELLVPGILAYRGTLIENTIGGCIAIFDNPVEAARCGIAIRQCMRERNALLPKHHRIEYRIGIDLGSVITAGDEVYGDGVDLASRLEAAAAPGQIYISAGMYEQIKQRVVCGYEWLGDRKGSSATDPVGVYRMLPDPDAMRSLGRRREKILISLLALTFLIMAAAGVTWYLSGQSQSLAGKTSKAWRVSSQLPTAKEAEPSHLARRSPELLPLARN
jgi:class 3 adenylate cyclase